MKRPAWAASPGFPLCWAALERRGKTDQLLDMAAARVVVFPVEQLNALPQTPESLEFYEVTESWTNPDTRAKITAENIETDGSLDKLMAVLTRLKAMPVPFGSVFLDCGGYDPGIPVYHDHKEANLLLRGMLVIEGELPLGFWLPRSSGLVLTDDHREELSAWTKLGISDVKWLRGQCGRISEDRTLAILDFLQSVNVEVVESPMKVQAREREIKKGREIALTVQVKQSKRRVSKQSENRADFSHRFEVRGHYTHHFETKPDGTPNKVFERYSRLHPEKVLTIQDQPCVRFWTPPFVKGPIDKPFVPKVRVVE